MPANALHSCTDVNQARNLIAAERLKSEGALRVFINQKDDQGCPPFQALMRMGISTHAVKMELLTHVELDVNATEDTTGMTIAHLCEHPEIMTYLVNNRPDFDPNVINRYTNQTALEYGIAYGKNPNITEILLQHSSLSINEASIQELKRHCSNPKSVAAIALVEKELAARRTRSTPGYNTYHPRRADPYIMSREMEEQQGNKCRIS